jgi:hypothetical protein
MEEVDKNECWANEKPSAESVMYNITATYDGLSLDSNQQGF